MKENTCPSVRLIVQLNSLEDILNTFSQQQVKTTEVLTQIESLRAQVPEMLLRRHDQLRRRGKRSVAEFRNGVCCGCHMQVATGSVPALIQGNSPQVCEHCGRLFYLLPMSNAGKCTEAGKRRGKNANKPSQARTMEEFEDQAVLAA